MFIVIEGIDGCGKTTQARFIYEWLIEQGRDVFLTAEPSKNRIGLFIREILSGSERVNPETLALLFTADRSEHLTREVKPALNDGKIVVMERYVNSTIAYQTAQGVRKEWIVKLNEFAIKPDLTIFIDLKPEIAVERIEIQSREIFENREFQEKVYKEYLNLKDMVRIDGNGSKKDIFNNIKDKIMELNLL